MILTDECLGDVLERFRSGQAIPGDWAVHMARELRVLRRLATAAWLVDEAPTSAALELLKKRLAEYAALNKEQEK